MDVYAQIAAKIIKEQKTIIGPIAEEQARKVSGITVASPDDIRIQGDSKAVITQLVEQYARLFGRASVEICKEAIEPIISQNPQIDLPDILKN